ncbi:MAG: hypothetical protein QOG64_1393 [Acidimicrobiaceae bacterium]|nr:hypothetical protein [Acidimicrobiaceae bacterium]
MRKLAAAISVLTMLSLPAIGAGARAATPPPPPAPSAATGVPAAAPAAAHTAEPQLPAPAGWPFPEAFPRTSGAGRVTGGASYWSDFLYDDHGAKGAPTGFAVVGLAPTIGTYTYNRPEAHQDGADIFRTAVAVDAANTWWRVDWQTLADRSVPIAEFALDVDRAPTGVAAWPAAAGVRSPGTDLALVITGSNAWLVNPKTGIRRAVTGLGGALSVDTNAGSFVVRLPRSALPSLAKPWTVRLAAGVNDGSGNFAAVSPANGALPGQPAVYNVAFRTYRQETPAGGNYWMEAAQANALAAGDVTSFSRTVDWSQLANHVSQPEPRPTGYTNRWYVSSVQDLGPGVIGPSNNAGLDDRPNYLGRVQPYAIYVPTTYDGRRAVPLTWILHSLSEQHNQYGVLAPRMLNAFCQQRSSICVTTLGRGPDGWYYDEAEVDFWEVWNRVASTYLLDPTRTAISGYSMGGFGTYKLGLSYPSLFARAVPMAAAVWCTSNPASPHCSNNYNTYPLLDNARWLPLAIFQGGTDEFGLVVDNSIMTERLDLLGYRYRFEVYPSEDHMVWLTQDNLTTAARHLDGTVHADPGHITFTWYPDLSVKRWGIGATGAWWISGVASDAAPGQLATVDAVSHAKPDPDVTTTAGAGPAMLDDGTPGAYRSLGWNTAPSSERPTATIDLNLTSVSAVTADIGRAGVTAGTVHVHTDRDVDLTLTGTASGPHRYHLAAGDHTISAG